MEISFACAFYPCNPPTTPPTHTLTHRMSELRRVVFANSQVREPETYLRRSAVHNP